jgi:hypothetical protein
MSMGDGLGFRAKDVLVDSLAIKQGRRRGLPRFRPSEGNTLLPAFLILIIDEDYNVVTRYSGVDRFLPRADCA